MHHVHLTPIPKIFVITVSGNVPYPLPRPVGKSFLLACPFLFYARANLEQFVSV